MKKKILECLYLLLSTHTQTHVTANMHSLEQKKKKKKVALKYARLFFDQFVDLSSNYPTKYVLPWAWTPTPTHCCDTLLIYGCNSSCIFHELQPAPEAPVTIFKATQLSFAGRGENFKSVPQKMKRDALY